MVEDSSVSPVHIRMSPPLEQALGLQRNRRLVLTPALASSAGPATIVLHPVQKGSELLTGLQALPPEELQRLMAEWAAVQARL